MQRVLWIVALWVLCACSSVGGGSQGDDAAPRADATTPVDVYEPPVDLCGAQPIVDANMMGTTSGRRTTVRFDPSLLERGGPLPPSAGCGRALRTTHRLVLRYTPTADAYLRIEISNDARVDRVVLLDGCSETAQRLACSGTSYDPEFHGVLPLVSRGPLRAGVPVYLAIALDAGSGTLTLDEIPDVVPLGEACDGFGIANVCAPGSLCANGPAARCVADGSPFGACRRTGEPCEPGFACAFGSPVGFAGRCAPRVLLGAACSPFAVCAEGACARCGTPGAGTCVAAAQHVGAIGEPCRVEDDGCDAGLVCSESYYGNPRRCWPTLPSGALCIRSTEGVDTLRRSTPDAVCPAGEVCATTLDNVQRCSRPGSVQGPCRNEGVCDAGLQCVYGIEATCVSPPAEGQACVPETPGQVDRNSNGPRRQARLLRPHIITARNGCSVHARSTTPPSLSWRSWGAWLAPSS